MWIVLISTLIFSIVLLSVWTWYNPESILIPLNLLYNFDHSPRTNFYKDEDMDIIFPVGSELEGMWKEIRDEGYQLYETLANKNVNYLNNYHMNIGDEDKRNWTTIPLRLFGRDSHYYMDKCHNLKNILQQHPEIKSCLFSIMEPGKIIKPHVGPYDGLLRYQLALDIPQKSRELPGGIITCGEKEECYLHVGEERYEWIEGKGVLFDEANLHGAINTTKQKRMVLLIDIERPYCLLLFRFLNRAIILGMGSLPATKQATLI